MPHPVDLLGRVRMNLSRTYRCKASPSDYCDACPSGLSNRRSVLDRLIRFQDGIEARQRTLITQFNFWNLAQLSIQRLDRILAIAVRDGLAVMPRDGIGYVRCKAILPPQSLKSMSPGVAWGEPFVIQAQSAHPSADHLRAIAATVSKSIR